MIYERWGYKDAAFDLRVESDEDNEIEDLRQVMVAAGASRVMRRVA